MEGKQVFFYKKSVMRFLFGNEQCQVLLHVNDVSCRHAIEQNEYDCGILGGRNDASKCMRVFCLKKKRKKG